MRQKSLRCIEWSICFSDVCRTISFFFLFPFPQYFLHGLAVHMLYVTSPGYMLSGVASECDSIVKSWRTFYRPAGSKKVYYSLAIPGDLRDRESGIGDSLTDRASENSQTCIDPLVAAGRWNSILRSHVGLSTRSTRRRALIESNSGSRKYGDPWVCKTTLTTASAKDWWSYVSVWINLYSKSIGSIRRVCKNTIGYTHV